MAKLNHKCETCNVFFATRKELVGHTSMTAHREAVERAREAERAMIEVKIARRTAVTAKTDIFRSNEVLGTLYYLNRELAQDVAKLEAEVGRLQERMTRDILKPIQRRGAEGIYGMSQLQSAHEISNLEGRIYGRRETLQAFASALNCRCEATYDPAVWTFYEALDRFLMVTLIEGEWRLSLKDDTSGDYWVFPTEGDAAIEAVSRARAVVHADPRFNA